MKLFLKRYVLTIAYSGLLFAICVLFASLSVPRPLPVFAQTVMLVLLIRVADDVNDYYTDLLEHKTVFSKTVLYILLSAFSLGILSAAIISRTHLFIIPAALILSLLFFNNKYLKMLLLPAISFVSFFYLAGLQLQAAGLVLVIFVISYLFSLFKKEKSLDPGLYGGKAYHLSKIKGVRIPAFISIPYNGLEEDKIKLYIRSFCKKNRLYAVRSSGIDEDSASASFAGVHESYLNVKYDDLYERVLLVRDSAFTAKALAYRKNNGMNVDDIRISVIIQEMIDADFAGVINTINPVTNDMNETVISVCEGLGDKLVDGSVDGTTYYINGVKEQIKGKDILTPSVKKKLLKLSATVQKQCDHFQDIEFCVRNNKVYLLQTRDITTYQDINCHEMKLLIDNSNIIESYYGVTSPLTFSFAKEVYTKVYKATFNAGHIRKKIIDSLDGSLNNMLYYYDGKIYYNLNSWYHVTSIFPSKKSTKYMESMMGVKTSNNYVKKVKLNLFDAVKVIAVFLNKLSHMEKLSGEFIDKFNRIVLPHYGKELRMTNSELKELYESIEKNVISEFATPIINDCAVMFYFGMLKEKAKKYKNSRELVNECVNNNGNVESANSARYMDRIVAFIKADKALYDNFKALPENELYDKYYCGDSELSKMLNEYVYLYGPRVMNELKLETKTMIEDKLILFSAIRNSLDLVRTEPARNTVEIPRNLRFLSSKAKYYIQNRERLRLKRTYVFSVVRNIFLAYGRNFFEEGRISDPDDIFYLTKDEIMSDKKDVRNLILERKSAEAEYKKHGYYNRVAFYETRILPVSASNPSEGLHGIPSGCGIVKARVSLLNNPSDKLVTGNIILTKRTDPGWITLFPEASGLIVEHGSMLSHSFVVAREMGLPAVVGVDGATEKIKDNDLVTLDGIEGVIRIEDQGLL